ncbi:MAG: Cys-Gln thioester bond-forming surface protein [Clostridiales Family XIII bacterium]|nr:Cys-Gln thioester bond-forming surface protein [Clostridiales Family XIII bacterium]
MNKKMKDALRRVTALMVVALVLLTYTFSVSPAFAEGGSDDRESAPFTEASDPQDTTGSSDTEPLPELDGDVHPAENDETLPEDDPDITEGVEIHPLWEFDSDVFRAYDGTPWLDSVYPSGLSELTDGSAQTRYIHKITGKPAYCLDHHKNNPKGLYNEGALLTSGMLAAAFYYGYPNAWTQDNAQGGHLTIPDANGNLREYPLLNDQAQCATQVVVWAVQGHLHIDYVVPDTARSDAAGAVNTYNACMALYDATQRGFSNLASTFDMPDSMSASEYVGTKSTSHVRYGPFNAIDATTVTASILDGFQTTQYYYGDASGNPISPASDQDFYLYVLKTANFSGSTPRIRIDAEYETFGVKVFEPQNSSNQPMGAEWDPPDGTASTTANLLPYGHLELTKTSLGNGFPQNGQPLPGCEFAMYESNGNGGWIRRTDLDPQYMNGKYVSPTLFATGTNGGGFKVEETGNPAAYWSPTITGHGWAHEFNLYNYGYGVTITPSAWGGSEPTNEPYNYGSVELLKVDSVTGNVLTGCAFKIQEWNGTAYVDNTSGYTIVWDANAGSEGNKGRYVSAGGPTGDGRLWETPTNECKFRVVETSNPAPFYWPVTYSTNYTQEILIGNSQYGGVITSETVENIPFKHNPVEIVKRSVGTYAEEGEASWKLRGAAFEVLEWDNSLSKYVPNTNGYYVEWDNLTRSYKTKGGTAAHHTDGQLWETTTNSGKFRIQETTQPFSYYDAVTTAGINQSSPAAITPWYADIEVTDNSEPMSPTIYKDAPNTARYAKITLQKHDNNTNFTVPQGDAKLGGATYGLYAAEAWTHPSDEISYTEDQLIESQVTDENGRAVFDLDGKLFPINYYIKEISPSEGYLLDPTVYPADVTYTDEMYAAQVTKVAITVDVKEQVKKQPFELFKLGSNNVDSELVPLEAGFKIYLISELSRVKAGTWIPESGVGGEWQHIDFGGYDFTDEPVAKVDGVTLPELWTDEDGILTSPPLPYGTYVVMESTVPEGKLGIVPFVVKVTENKPTEPQVLNMEDEPQEFYIKLTKKDLKTGAVVKNNSATYRIWDLVNNKYIVMSNPYSESGDHLVGTPANPYRTNKDGYFITPQKLEYGFYRIDEMDAPIGYVHQGFEGELLPGYQTDDRYTQNPRGSVYLYFDETSPKPSEAIRDSILEVVQMNDPQKGKLSLYKEGDTLAGMTAEDGALTLTSEARALSGATFEIIAAEDILTPDGQTMDGTLTGPRKTLFAENAVVTTLVTNAKGQAASDALPIGKYILRETDAPDGFLLTDDREFEVTAADQEIAFTFHNYEISDARQKLNIEITKLEEGSNFPLPGAKFGLYAAEDIYAGEAAPEPQGILAQIGSFIADALTADPIYTIPQDALVRTATTGEDGKALFADLPPGEYLVKEIDAPDGYERNEEFAGEFTLSYDTASGEETLVFKDTCENRKYIVSCQVDKDTIRRTSAAYRSLPGEEEIDNVGKERYRYDIDYRATSNVFADEFVVDDPLENVAKDQVRVEEVYTAITWGDFDGLFNVWYKTNKTDDLKTYSDVSAMDTNPDNYKNPDRNAAYPNTGFKLWAEDLTATERHKLSVSDLGLAEDEYITALRFEHGGVNVGFTSKNYADVSLNGEHRASDITPPATSEPAAAAQMIASLSAEENAAAPLATGITGDIVDWTPQQSDPYYAAEAAAADGLRPVSYLVSAPRAYEGEDIESSVTARITRDYTLRDDDADHVITKEIETFTYETKDDAPNIETTFRAVKTGDRFMLRLWISLALVAIAGVFSLLMMISRVRRGGKTHE